MELIKEGIEKGIIKFDETQKFITYTFQNKKRNWSNPEEKVQAEAFCKLVLFYGYSEKRIRLYEPIKMGSTEKEADLIVYSDDELTQPYIVVECKNEDVTELEFQEAVKQAFSYAFALAGTTKFIWVTKGNKEEFYIFDKEKSSKETIPDLLAFGQNEAQKYRFAKGAYYLEKIKGADVKVKATELQATSEAELTRLFKQAHDALWAGGELNPSQAFDELDKLVFCKVWDERYTKKGEPYQFQVIKEKPEELKERILKLYEKGKEKDKEVFNKPLELSAERIKVIVEYFQKVSFSETDLDSKGKAFETFLGSYFRGNFGQYFTPRNVVKFSVEVLPMNYESKVLDTSCGSGGFLLYCLDKIRKQADKLYDLNNPKEAIEHYNHWHGFAEKNLFGIEISDQISRVAKMNMIIHDDGHTNVVQFDGLFPIEYIAKTTGNKGFAADSFDFIVTNPPFGSIVKQSEKSYMKVEQSTAPYYDFSLKDINWIDKQLKPNHLLTGRENQATEILFIEQCHKFLKAGGYLAVVIPDGILTNSSMAYVREGIEEKFRIVGVVSLPQTAFTHTGAGVKSSVMFLKKHTPETTLKIKQLKEQLAKEIAQERKLKVSIDKWNAEKKAIQNQLKKETNEDVKEIGNRKIEELNEKINGFLEDLTELYETQKQSRLNDYPIFMAIAENIGYDATGKSSDKLLLSEEKGNNIFREVRENDLFVYEVIKENQKEIVNIIPNTGIAGELKRFIEAIEAGTDSFFA
ncbi:MAG: N-6 DNA methylase [Spirosomataceae bacterium]